MKDRYQLVKDEIMHIMKCTPAANYSVSSLHDRLKNKVTRTEIDRAVACLLSRQHITRVKRHTYGLGETKPYDLSEYDEKALPDMTSPAMSNKQRIAEAEKKREQQQQSKSFKHWSGGDKSDTATEHEQAVLRDKALAEAVLPVFAEIFTPIMAGESHITHNDAINYELQQLRLQVNATPKRPAIKDLATKLNTLDQLAQLAGPATARLLEDIKTDLKGIAA